MAQIFLSYFFLFPYNTSLYVYKQGDQVKNARIKICKLLLNLFLLSWNFCSIQMKQMFHLPCIRSKQRHSEIVDIHLVLTRLGLSKKDLCRGDTGFKRRTLSVLILKYAEQRDIKQYDIRLEWRSRFEATHILHWYIHDGRFISALFMSINRYVR